MQKLTRKTSKLFAWRVTCPIPVHCAYEPVVSGRNSCKPLRRPSTYSLGIRCIATAGQNRSLATSLISFRRYLLFRVNLKLTISTLGLSFLGRPELMKDG